MLPSRAEDAHAFAGRFCDRRTRTFSCVLRRPCARAGPSQCPRRHRHRRARRRVTGRHGDRDLAGVDRFAHRRHRGERQLPRTVGARRDLHDQLRAERVPDLQAREHRAVARPDADDRRAVAGAGTAGERHRHSGVAARRCANDERGVDAQHREAHWRADCDGPLERTGAIARRPHAGLRRRRQPQERADGLRGVRRPRPVARRH